MWIYSTFWNDMLKPELLLFLSQATNRSQTSSSLSTLQHQWRLVYSHIWPSCFAANQHRMSCPALFHTTLQPSPLPSWLIIQLLLKYYPLAPTSVTMYFSYQDSNNHQREKRFLCPLNSLMMTYAAPTFFCCSKSQCGTLWTVLHPTSRNQTPRASTTWGSSALSSLPQAKYNPSRHKSPSLTSDTNKGSIN